MRIARWLLVFGIASSLRAASHFDTHVAPVLGRHCVECHGPETKKARLDLSRKDAAFAGGKSGKVIVPGQAAESLLWKNVESGEMPQDRPPLSAKEKEILRKWIDEGANWPANTIVVSPPRDANVWLRRLTIPEYIETVRSAVGVNIAQEARRLLPPDLRADGFHNTAYNLTVDLPHVEAYAALAQVIVERMDVLAFVANYTQCQELDETCLRKVITRIGKSLLRGPLEEREIASFLRVSTAVAKAGGNFKEAVSYVLEAMLQSPRFIYRIEKEEKGKSVGPYELASRMSYVLWGAPPDQELMRAADAGELTHRTNVHTQVRRMLKDKRAVERSSRFISEWLNLDRLANLRPDKKRFPNWDAQLASAMREETLAFFNDVVWKQQRPLWDLMNAKVTYATPRLAEHYGLKRDDTSAGLQVLYRFDEGKGDTVRDVSGVGEPMNLKIANTSAIKWSKGRLTINSPTIIASEQPPKRLIDALKKSNAVTLEAWLTPRDAQQKGPARVLTLSADASQRNFTLGQEGDKYDVRFRSTKTDGNGQPSLTSASGAAQARPTHVVYTRDPAGKAKLYVNGELKGNRDVSGDLSNWDQNFSLTLANESTKDRPWRGTFDLIAIYNRAFTSEEIRSRGQGLSRYDLASVSTRGGLLTQGSVLTVGGDDASMVARGLFVLEDILADKVGDPPPCVDTTPIPPKPGLSLRAIAETRLANASCRGCHARFEPLAFGLEKFDGVGAYHERDEHGNKLREDGEILFPDAKQTVAYKSSAEFMDLLAKSPRVRKVITRKLTQFALGRPLTQSDLAALDTIHANTEKEGGTYASAITAIVLSDLVRSYK